jgi:uncharacterized membrane protein YkoI
LFVWVELAVYEQAPPGEKMKRTFQHIGSIALVLTAACAWASDKKIERSALPPAVEKKVTEITQDATIRGFELESENGTTLYEAKFLVNGHKKNVLMDESGAIVEVEEEVNIADLPAAVREGLQAKAGTGTLAKVEAIRKHDKLVAYEAKVMTDGKKSEVQVGPDGKPLDHEE